MRWDALESRRSQALCRLVSTLSYQGQLVPHPTTAARSIGLTAAACPALWEATRPPSVAEGSEGAPRAASVAGVVFVPAEHQGNTQASAEEAEGISTLCEELLRAELLDGTRRRRVREEDILVVAPYNLQVRELQAALPKRVRVGTVDRFQGQEAPIVLLSLCHSDFDGAGHADTAADTAADGSGASGEAAQDGVGGAGTERGLSFVLNLNRLNVALSRAQSLAVVVGSPRLSDASPRTLQQQRELNALCLIMEGGHIEFRPIHDS